MSALPFSMPPARSGEPAPSWDGTSFLVGEQKRRVLAYHAGVSGWNDDLTRLHEDETAGGTHFIDVASRGRAMAALKTHLHGKPAVLLEVGVSGGHFLRELRREFPGAVVVGADYTQGTLDEIAPSFEGVPLVRMDLTDSPFPDASADAIILLNVLEHIKRDDVAVGHCVRMLKPGGILVVEVPAGPDLFDSYDRELMHFRRYRGSELARLLSDAGLDVLEQSHIGFLLYPLFWFSKKKNRWATSTERATAGSRVKAAIRGTSRFGALGHWLMAAEYQLSRRVALPVGIRCTAAARKPPSRSP